MANKQASDPHQKSAQHRYSLLRDIWKGAVQGEYADHLGLVGALTRIAIGFIPVVGTACALRDYFACRRKRDNIGAALNAMALLPIAGGFPQAAETIRDMTLTMEMMHSGAHYLRGVAISRDATDWSKHADAEETPEPAATHQPDNAMQAHERSLATDVERVTPVDTGSERRITTAVSPPRDDKRNDLALFSLCSGILAPMLLLLGVGILVPPITVVTGHLAMRRARRMTGSRYARPAMSRIALIIGYVELISFGIAAALAAWALYLAYSRLKT